MTRLPTEKQCLDYFKKYNVPNNIFEHCLNVRNVSLFIGGRLKENGVNINLDLVNCLALLHDLFKVVSLSELKPSKFHHYEYSEDEIEMWKQLRKKYLGMYEGEVAFEIFKDEFPEMALGLKRLSDPHIEDKTWEEFVVHYADWRVFKNKIVSIKERLDYAREVYPREKGAWEADEKIIRDFEGNILENVNINPYKLAEEMEIE